MKVIFAAQWLAGPLIPGISSEMVRTSCPDLSFDGLIAGVGDQIVDRWRPFFWMGAPTSPQDSLQQRHIILFSLFFFRSSHFSRTPSFSGCEVLSLMLMCKLMQQADLGCFIQVVWPQMLKTMMRHQPRQSEASYLGPLLHNRGTRYGQSLLTCECRKERSKMATHVYQRFNFISVCRKPKQIDTYLPLFWKEWKRFAFFSLGLHRE